MKCSSCNGELDSIYISDQKGRLSHPKCYYKFHPFILKENFKQVFYNTDDNVLVFQLLNVVLTYSQQVVIVNKFNQIMQERWNSTQDSV